MFNINLFNKICNPFQNFLTMAEASTATPERTLRPRKGKSTTTENADSTTNYMMTEKGESSNTRNTLEAWFTTEESAQVVTENKIQEELAINDIHTSLDLGIDYIEGNTIEVMLTSGDTTVEEVELREEDDCKEDTGLDQDLRQEPPEPMGSSTPKHSAETEGEYVEDAENKLVTK